MTHLSRFDGVPDIASSPRHGQGHDITVPPAAGRPPFMVDEVGGRPECRAMFRSVDR